MYYNTPKNLFTIRDAQEVDEMFNEHYGLLINVVYKYRARLHHIEWEDFVQQASFGLIYACHTYDESQGFTFGTYATRCIVMEVGKIFKWFTHKDRGKQENWTSSLNELMGSSRPSTTAHKEVEKEEFLIDTRCDEQFKNIDLFDKLQELVLQFNWRERFAWRIINGDMTYNDVREELGEYRSNQAIGNWTRALKNKLKEELEVYYEYR